jgi:photosystem II stability/assembly factor-like uncharacterized protein
MNRSLLSLMAGLPMALSLAAQTPLEIMPTGMTGTIRGLDVVSDSVVWISGSNGEFSMTRNGGRTWFHDTLPGCRNLDFRDIQGFSASRALLMSAGPGTGSTLYRTEDGGATWHLMYRNTDEKAFFDGMDFFDKRHGLVIGDPIDEKPYLLETFDGGLSWSRLVPESIPDLLPGEYAFAASGTGLCLTPDGTCHLVTGGSASRIFCSVDFGKNWTVAGLPLPKGDPASGAFSCASGDKGLLAVCGGNYREVNRTGTNVVLSRNKGVDWSVPEGAREVPFMECIRWLAGNRLIACGPPGIWISDENSGGWTELSEEGFHTLDVTPGSKTVWLAGNRGKVVRLSGQ